MSKQELNKEISILIKRLNFQRQNPELTPEQLEEVRKKLELLLTELTT